MDDQEYEARVKQARAASNLYIAEQELLKASKDSEYDRLKTLTTAIAQKQRAALIAEEREACALVAEEVARGATLLSSDEAISAWRRASEEIAARIRSR